MPNYQSESFYRAKISQSILSNTAVPFTVRLSKLPTITNGLLTISPNTENEEMVEYNNLNSTNSTIDIIKRGIKPSSILLTTNAVDYNNTAFYKPHTQNDIIRGDVNHIHINQGIGNTTLATNLGVGIAKLSVAAVDAWNPIVVGDNDTRLIPVDASVTVKGLTKLSVAPVSAVNPIAVGDNDTRLVPTDATLIFTDITTNNVSVAKHWFAPKLPNTVDTFLDGTWAYSRWVPAWVINPFAGASAPTWWLLADGTAVSRTTYSTLFWVVSITYGTGDGSTTFNLPNLKWRVPVGRDIGQTEFDVLGETGGAKTHTLSTAEMPSHRHRVNVVSWGSSGEYRGHLAEWQVSNWYTDTFGWTISAPAIENTWGGWAHNNLQPYLTMNYIIKF